MSPELFFIALLVGWCAGHWSRILPLKPEPPCPKPGPWIRSLIAAVLGGLGGGYVILRVWPRVPHGTGTDALVTALGAWIGAIVVSDIICFAGRGGRPKT